MWICLCRHITHKDVEEAISKGAKNAEAIFAYHNKFPRCEACLPKMEEMVEESKEEMVDVVSIQHNSMGSGPCIFVLEKDEKGNTKTNTNLLEELNLFVTEDEHDWELTVKRYKMTMSEVENLPEFRGW